MRSIFSRFSLQVFSNPKSLLYPSLDCEVKSQQEIQESIDKVTMRIVVRDKDGVEWFIVVYKGINRVKLKV